MPGKKAATSLATLAGPATNGPTAPPEDNVESLYPQADLNEMWHNAQIFDVNKVKHPITATPRANGLNMPPPYTEMAAPLTPSAPPISASSNVLPAYNSIAHQSMPEKWLKILMDKLKPESNNIRHKPEISPENLNEISKIINKFGVNESESIYDLFAKQVYKIYEQALEKYKAPYNLNKYIKQYLDVFNTLLSKFGANFIIRSDVMQLLPKIEYEDNDIPKLIILHINEGRIGLEGVGYLIDKQINLNALQAILRRLQQFLGRCRNITQDQIVYFALYLNKSINHELYFGLWNDFHDYTQDISVYNDFINELQSMINRLELRDKTEINKIFVTRLLELLTDYVPQTAKRAERAGIKKVLLKYFIAKIDKNKTIPDEAYFKKHQAEILTTIGYGDLLKGGARCAKTTIKKQHTHRKKHTRKL